MSLKATKVLLIGPGRIGERHLSNLQLLNCDKVIVLRHSERPLKKVLSKKYTSVFSFEQALEQEPTHAIICTPPSTHLDFALKCAAHKMHIFIEPPLGNKPELLDELKESVILNGVYFQMGYMLRYHPLLQKVKDSIDQKTYGKLVHFFSYRSEFPADWLNLSEQIETTENKGVAFNLSYDIEILLWLLGSGVQNYDVTFNNIASADRIDTLTDIAFRFKNGSTAICHFNFLEPVSTWTHRIIFEKAVLFLDLNKFVLVIKTLDGEEIKTAHNFDKNQMFLDEIQDFLFTSTHFKTINSLKNIEIAEQIIRICLN